MVTVSDDSTLRIWRLAADISQRGSDDIRYGIIGEAERTHREIGEDLPKMTVHVPTAVQAPTPNFFP